MFNFIIEKCHEDELRGKDLVQLLTDDSWSCALIVDGEYVAINDSDHKRLIQFPQDSSEIVRYAIDKLNKQITQEKGYSFRSPFYDVQKVHFEIPVEKQDGNTVHQQDFLKYFIQNGYKLNSLRPK